MYSLLPENTPIMSYVYFIQLRYSGYLIKISKTDDCPYVRLGNLRSAMRNRHIELLGAIAVPTAQCLQRKYEIQSQFESLRCEHEKSDWYLPGAQMVAFIREHAKPHLCNWSCSGGTTIEEEMRAKDAAADAAFQHVIDSQYAG
jgi:hypothetical protein